MNNVHPIFSPILESIFPTNTQPRNSLLHDSIVTLLKRAKADGHHLTREGLEGYKFIGPNAIGYEGDIREMAKALGHSYQEMDVNMQDCIEQSGIEVQPSHPLQGFADWLIAGKPKI